MLPDLAAARRHLRRRLHVAAEAVRPPAAARRHLDERPDGGRLHVGCGGALLPGWLNTDRDPVPGAAHLDVTRRFPLPDASFRHLLCEHVIEHLPLEDGRRMLAEAARVLRPGGRIRISTPDLARIARLCTAPESAGGERYARWAVESFVPGAVGSRGALVLNNAMRAWDHRFLYDEETLARALLDAGFTEVRRLPYRESGDPAFAGAEGRGVDAVGIEMRTWETLALEATRV